MSAARKGDGKDGARGRRLSGSGTLPGEGVWHLCGVWLLFPKENRCLTPFRQRCQTPERCLTPFPDRRQSPTDGRLIRAAFNGTHMRSDR